ncbi:hypothetical protein [Lysobacter sp. CA199]|uniref:hypothetical protein n=1 Tax=Lysobacter sp. CA199 TaxID=3455608 RepID=UPI003F8D329B
MKCYQCISPAMYTVGEQNIPLCLDCYFKFSQIQQQELESLERAVNYSSDEIAFATGMPGFGAHFPRFPPRPKPTFIQGVKMNNISVQNSVIGTINTGSIGTVDQSISALISTGQPDAAEAVKAISEAVLKSADLTGNQKNDLIDILSVVAKEAATPIESRKSGVALALIDKAEKITGLANDITDICQKWWPALVAVFTAATG